MHIIIKYKIIIFSFFLNVLIRQNYIPDQRKNIVETVIHKRPEDSIML